MMHALSAHMHDSSQTSLHTQSITTSKKNLRARSHALLTQFPFFLERDPEGVVP